MKHFILLASLVILLSACKKQDYLVQVNANGKVTDGNSIIALSKEGNFTPLVDSMALLKYFAPGEVHEIIGGRQSNTYGLYKEFETPNYRLAVILQVQKNEDSEAYYYYLRTYDKTGVMVDHYDFAALDARMNVQCSATISKEYEIQRKCNTGAETWKITPAGNFESVPAEE